MESAQKPACAVFRTPQNNDKDTEDLETSFHGDPVTKTAKFNSQDPEFNIRQYPRAEKDGYLFVEAIVFQFIPDYGRPVFKVRERGRDEIFAISLRGTACRIKIMSTDREVNKPAEQMEQQFLLLARDRGGGWMYHYLLLLDFEENVAVRRTVLELLVPEDDLEVLEELEPRKRRVVLS